VRLLSANPLLLTILALMKRQGVTLPERRVELYDQYVKTLLSTWNRARGLDRPPTRDLDPVQTVKILAPLALWMHETNPGVGLVKREAMRRELTTLYASYGEADPEACTRQFLKDVHDYASLLLERGPGEYGFIHLTFEEYLAAVAIALQAQGQVDAIVTALAAHIGEPAWHEIGLLTVSYLGLIQQLDTVAGSVVETLVSKQPGPAGAAVVLAAEATIDAGTVGIPSASRERVITVLVETLQQDRTVPAKTRCRAGRALATLGDPRPGVSLDMNGLPDLLWVQIPGTAAVRESGRFPNFIGLKLGSNVRQDLEKFYNETWPPGNQSLEVTDFKLAGYPLTVAQFRPFVEQDGYQRNHYWSEAGRCWRDRENLKESQYWNDPVWTLANHPVVGVSWYEAEAYCNWLNDQLQLPRGTIRLPTEAEWEWAVRGPEGQYYPWGKRWEVEYCNSGEWDSNCTSAVGCFPSGVANWWQDDWPSGVLHDMVGNVWEWMASSYHIDYHDANCSKLNTDYKGSCVLRGGSWFSLKHRLRSAARYGSPPGGRDKVRGMRLARSLSVL
jgi:formylglycine-generating enzyme required for sulfatase activity